MQPSLRAFLSGIIDYAGLFPPAALPMTDAVRNYARHRTGPDAWMLGRFVCPAARLREWASCHDQLFANAPPVRFSAVGRGGKAEQEFLNGVRADVQDIASFREQHGAGVVVDAFETRLPDTVVRDADQAVCRNLLRETAALFATHGPSSLTPFYEASLGEDWPDEIAPVIEAIRRHKQRLPENRVRAAGFKLRCGGLAAAAFPSVAQVAFVITACRDAGVPLKCTAGLHHPIRHYNDGVATKMHGFINVFGAGVLAHVRGLSEQRVRAILEDESAEDFAFADDAFHWRDLSATAEQVTSARRTAATSFGSCSFDEPRDGLRSLGWL